MMCEKAVDEQSEEDPNCGTHAGVVLGFTVTPTLLHDGRAWTCLQGHLAAITARQCRTGPHLGPEYMARFT